ncbi:MAG: hypothetical protein EA422_08285 [Gemmatimonadales bacterium]|nr:MAG: hypothetical protein EA422_08285 [Gemmatimonadales bacterium]
MEPAPRPHRSGPRDPFHMPFLVRQGLQQPHPTSRFRSASLGLLAVLLTFAAFPGTGPSFLEAQAPTFEEVVGFDLGHGMVQHHEMVRYLEALAASSDRVRLVNQGRSIEGRDLWMVVVSDPANLQRLDEIREVARRLNDPRGTSRSEAEALLVDQPVISWIGGTLHGFELSGTEAVLMALERLTTSDDAETRRILQESVVLLDPILNPDGRDHFVLHNLRTLGRVPASDRRDWSNDFTGWEARRYRTNHYYHDPNRDWFAHVFPETRARVTTVRDWRPQILVDIHEMGADVEFYFDPPTDPINPFFPDFGTWGFELFGAAYREAFDEAGFEYMTEERFTFFFPGFLTAFGSYQGGVGMLFEQGSTRGLAMTRADGSVRTFRDAVDQQYVATWTALVTAADHREELLSRYDQGHRDAVADGESGIRRYILPAGEADPHHLRELVDLLLRNGIEVDRLTEEVRIGGLRDRTGAGAGERTFPVGSYVVEAAQPRNRMIRVLLEPETPVPAPFLELARERIDRGENPRFYDVTSFSLPLFFNQPAFSSSAGGALPVERVTETADGSQAPGARAAYAYLLDGHNSRSLSVAAHLRERGYRMAFLAAPTQIGGEVVPSGSIVVRTGQNEASVHDSVRELAIRFGVAVRPVDSGAGDPGFPALGTGDAFPMVLPRIALVAEGPVDAYSFGYAWGTLDWQYEIPNTVIRAESLGGADLGDFNVLVIPEAPAGALARLLGEAGMESLRHWVRHGGTLITIGAAVDFARDPLGLLSLRSWYDTEAGADAVPYDAVGAFFRGELNRAYWLASGIPTGELPVQVRSSRLYLAPTGSPSAGRRVVGTFASDDLNMSGHAWPETLERAPGTVFAYEERIGSGRVIAFSEDVNFRGYWRGGQRLFLNAAVLGPSAP